jgi:hypothetical protein
MQISNHLDIIGDDFSLFDLHFSSISPKVNKPKSPLGYPLMHNFTYSSTSGTSIPTDRVQVFPGST